MLDFIKSLSSTDLLIITLSLGSLLYISTLFVKESLIRQNKVLIKNLDKQLSKNNIEYTKDVTDFTKDFKKIINKYYSSANLYFDSNIKFLEISNLQFSTLGETISEYTTNYDKNYTNTITFYHKFSDFKILNNKEISSYFINTSKFFDKILNNLLLPLNIIENEIVLKNHNLKISGKVKDLKEINSKINNLGHEIEKLSDDYNKCKKILESLNLLNFDNLKTGIKFFSEENFEGIQLYYSSFFEYMNEKLEIICHRFNVLSEVFSIYSNKLNYNLSVKAIKLRLNINVSTEIILLCHIIENYSFKLLRADNDNSTFYIKKTIDVYELIPLNISLIESSKKLRDMLYYYDDEKNLKYNVELPPQCIINELNDYEISIKGKLI